MQTEIHKQHNTILVSIVIPVYNVEKYLVRCIESVQNQTYETLEIILVDDGSQDSSGLICDAYKQKDARIQVIHKENGGLSAARNSGLEVARGEYIAFLDSDDSIHPQFVEIMLDACLSSGASVAQCAFYIMTEDDKEDVREYNKDEIEIRKRNGETACRALYDSSMEYGFVQAWAKLYKAECFKELRYPVGKIYEDIYVTYRLLYEAEIVILVCEKLLFHYLYETSIVGVNLLTNKDDWIDVFPIQLAYYKDKSSFLYQYAAWNFVGTIVQHLHDLRLVNQVFGTDDDRIIVYEKKLKEAMKLCFNIKSVFLSGDLATLTKLCIGFSKKRLGPIYNNSRKRITCLFENRYIKKDNVKKVFIMNTPEHGNLGDHLITLATKEFILRIAENAVIYEISRTSILFNMKSVKQKVGKEDLIIINGGGNLGSLWPENEDAIRTVIRNFPDNGIIIFPQTLSYAKDRYAGLNKKIDYRLISEHKNITVALRETFSYCKMGKEMASMGFENSSDLICVPDIALYYGLSIPEMRKQGIALCLREDQEAAIRKDDVKRIKEIVENSDEKTCYTSTLYNGKVKKNMRRMICNMKLQEFAGYRLVITDRLYGMIFSILAGTPCLALDNSTRKVSGVYEWIRDLNYVKLVNPEEVTETLVSKMLEIVPKCYDHSLIDNDFMQLKKRCIQYIGKKKWTE